MKIKSLFLIGFCFILLIVAFSDYYTYNGLTGIDSSFSKFIIAKTPAVVALQDIRHYSYNTVFEVNEYILDPAEEHLEEFEEYKSKLQQAMEILMEAEGEEEEGELMEYFDTESAAIIADSGKLIAAKDDGESMEKLIADYRALDKKNENFLEKLDEEIEHDTKQLNAQREIVANAVRSALKFGVLMSAVLIGILLMALLLVFQYFLKPISMLEKGANKVGAGDLEFRLNIKRNDEIGSTAESFDTMAAKLQKSREVMQNYSKELEKKVKEKTKTLEKTNEDLQKFKNLAVGRELKMIELKKKLKEKD